MEKLLLNIFIFVLFTRAAFSNPWPSYQNSIPNVQLPLDYGSINEDIQDDACDGIVITTTQFVPSTTIVTRTRVFPMPMYREVTQTSFIQKTVLRPMVVTALADPVVRTSTQILIQPKVLVSNSYLTKTSVVTTTKVRVATKTSFKYKNNYVTATTTQYQTQYNTQYQTLYRTTTQLAYSTLYRTVPQYVTTTVASQYPVYQTIVNTHSQIHYMTVTRTEQANPPPAVTITKVITSFYDRTVQGPCTAAANPGYY